MDSDTLTKFLAATYQNPDHKARAESILAEPEADRPKALATLSTQVGTPITADEFRELLAIPIVDESELPESTLQTITGGSIDDIWSDFLNIFSSPSQNSGGTTRRKRILIR